jgi:hypothetical protein
MMRGLREMGTSKLSDCCSRRAQTYQCYCRMGCCSSVLEWREETASRNGHKQIVRLLLEVILSAPDLPKAQLVDNG